MPLKTAIARAILALLLIPLALIVPAGAQTPEPRIALVLGNAEYRAGPLATSANDAGLIAETLRNAGFDVTGAANLDQDQTRRAFREFLEKASAAGPQAVIFVYLAGRGLQFEGENYFVPVDATIPRDSDVPAQAVRISDLTRPLAGTPLKARMFVLDLARANTFAQGGAPLAPGLALVEPEDGSLIAFNAAPGTIAPDERPPYAAYAQALSEMMREGGLPVDEVFARTRLRVNELTRGAEVPWHASKINVPFVFFERAPGAPAPVVSPEARANIARRPVRDFPVEEAYSVALDRDTIAAYQEFLNAYPNSPLSRRVRALLAARREALIWRRAVTANRPEAYWTYVRRYPQGPHVADARRRLALISAPLDPPPQFTLFEYDVPPPPPDEVVIIEQRRTYFFDDPDYAPPPAAPVLLLGPRERDYYVPPPPPPMSRGFLPIPVGVPMPYARPVERQGGFAAPAFMPQPPRTPTPAFQPAQVPGGAPSAAPSAPPSAPPSAAPGAAPPPTPQPTPGQRAPGQPPRPGQPGQPNQPGAAAPPPQALPPGKPLPPGAQPPRQPGALPAPSARPGGPGTPPRMPGAPAAPGAAPTAQPAAPAAQPQPQPLPGARPPGAPAAPGGSPGGPRPSQGVKPVSPPAAKPPAAPPAAAAPAASPPAAAPKPAAPAVAPRPAAPPPAAAPAAPRIAPPAAAPRPAPAAPPPAAPKPPAPPPAAAPPHGAPPAAPRPAPPPPAAAPHVAPPPPAAVAPRPAPPPPAAVAPRPAPPPPAAVAPRPAAPPPPAAVAPRPAPPPPAAAAPHPAAPAPAKPACGLPGLPPCPH